MSSVVLGGGCFWCTEAAFNLIAGITEVTPGYAGGSSINPTYASVASGKTGHAEVVRVQFDPAVISLEDVLDIFWAIHNPTTLNQQGNDVGTEYRSIILYSTPEQKVVIDHSLAHVAKLWNDPIVTEVAKLDVFYPAEEEHKNFFEKHPEMGYCQVIINPKLQLLKQKFASKLKT